MPNTPYKSSLLLANRHSYPLVFNKLSYAIIPSMICRENLGFEGGNRSERSATATGMGNSSNVNMALGQHLDYVQMPRFLNDLIGSDPTGLSRNQIRDFQWPRLGI